MERDFEGKDWATLPKNFLVQILNRLISIQDHLNFSLVCKRWLLCKKDELHKITIPMLIVPSDDGTQKLYDFTEHKICDSNFKVSYSERCFGSSHGWLIMVGDTIDIILLNPFLGLIINLPPIIREMDIYISEKPYYYPCHFTKSILTKDPLLYPNDYFVITIYGPNNKLAIIKPNDDETWTYINPNDSPHFEDVNVHNGVIYALDFMLGLWKVQLDRRNSTFSLIRVTVGLDPSPLDPIYNATYVAESSSGHLLLVQRLISADDDESTYYKTTSFKVYKLSDICEDGMRRHVEVKSLDNDAMFIGNNRSMCLSTKDFPQCLPNRIYYTDNFIFFGIHLEDGPHDAGIFNLEDGSFSTQYIVNPAHRYLPPPIWIIPTLHL